MSWLRFEGSTRAIGLLRIALGLIAWARFGDELLPFRDYAPERVALSLVFWVGTTGMVLGLFSRLTTALGALALFTAVFGFGRNGVVEDWNHHHTTVLTLFTVFLTLTPCGSSFSVDRWLAVRRARKTGAPLPPERGDLWATRLIGLQISSIYFWSALDKATPQFLSGARLEQIFLHVWWKSDFAPPAFVHGLFLLAAVAVVVAEFTLPFTLWLPRTRALSVAAGVVMHALFYLLLPVQTFTVTMLAGYLVFLDPEAVSAFVDDVLAKPGG